MMTKNMCEATQGRIASRELSRHPEPLFQPMAMVSRGASCVHCARLAATWQCHRGVLPLGTCLLLLSAPTPCGKKKYFAFLYTVQVCSRRRHPKPGGEEPSQVKSRNFGHD